MQSFVGTVQDISEALLGITYVKSDAAMNAAEDWAESVGGIMQVADQSAQLLKQLETFYMPDKSVVDNFIMATEYIAEAFSQNAQTWDEDIAEDAAFIAEQFGVVFTMLGSAASVFQVLPTLTRTPQVMIDGFFNNMDQAIDAFNDRAEQWDRGMSFATIRISEDIEKQMGALSGRKLLL